MKIIFFSGTGNSKYAALRIAELAGVGAEDVLDAGREIKANRPGIVTDNDVVVCTPVYAWRIPDILEDWLRSSDFTEVRRIWYVMTCGDQIGGADKFNARISADLGCQHMGTAEIIMPENYIAMFNAPFEDESLRIIEAAKAPIDKATRLISVGEPIPPSKQALLWKIGSTVFNPAFKALFIKDKAFTAGPGCTGCGLCVEKCPLNNIRIADGLPVWGGNCTHCMACICYCPCEAIEYGSTSAGKFRYNLERVMEKVDNKSKQLQE